MNGVLTRGVGWAIGLGLLGSCSQADDNLPPPPPPSTPAICGNGVLEEPEQCDDGDTRGDLVCDRQCELTCGNGIVDDGEVCDPNDEASCPTTVAGCDDGDACTIDVINDAECQSACVHLAMASETCCSSGSSAGQGACEAETFAYRLTSFKLRDPHAFLELSVCSDITDIGALAINRQYIQSINSDNDNDGWIDYGLVLALEDEPTIATAGTPFNMHFNFANCAADGTWCQPSELDISAPATVITSGACLDIDESTLHGYTPGVVTPTAACITSSPTTASLSLGGIPLILEQTQISATLVGDPAQGMINGVIRGFLTEATANATTIPLNLPLVGGKKLSVMLAGGRPAGGKNCASHDDRDTHNGQSGWWFYVNFTAERVDWQVTP